jgi:hypothetical protein
MDASTPATQPIPDGDATRPLPDERPHVSSPVQDTPGPDSPGSRTVGTPVAPPPHPTPRGPNAAAVVLGLVALALAALVIANETIGLRVDWSRLGPGAIVAIGGLLVVLGAIGLVRRHDDA